jgi:hypothetical protein
MRGFWWWQRDAEILEQIKLYREQRRLELQERRESRRERRDYVAIFIALFAAGFTCWQAWEAHQTRKDTQVQFEQAQHRADRDADQARKDAREAINVQTELAGHSAEQARRSADAAKYAAETTAKQLELSERPWIKIIDVKTTGDNPIIPALSFQQIGPYKDVSQQATFQLIISLKNIGHSVADVAASFELFFPVWDSSGYSNVVSSEQKRFCDSPAGKVPQFYPKFVVFPDESFDWHGAAAGLIHSGVTNHLPGQGDTGYILPVMIVCVNYRLRPLNNSYQTRTIYEAVHAEDRSRFFKIGEGVPAKRILLMRNEMADDAY